MYIISCIITIPFMILLLAFFFFNDTATTEIYTLSLHDALPIQDSYDNLSASTGQRFLAMPFQCLSCHNGLGHLEQVNSAMAKRTRYDFWRNAAFFAQVTIAKARDAVTNQTETTLTDNT